MTDDEKREQKKELLFAHSEAEENLAHLREKATRMASSLNKMAEALRDPARVVPAGNLAMPMPGIRNPIGFEPSQFETISPQDILAVCKEIREAERTLQELSERKHLLRMS